MIGESPSCSRAHPHRVCRDSKGRLAGRRRPSARFPIHGAFQRFGVLRTVRSPGKSRSHHERWINSQRGAKFLPGVAIFFLLERLVPFAEVLFQQFIRRRSRRRLILSGRLPERESAQKQGRKQKKSPSQDARLRYGASCWIRFHLHPIITKCLAQDPVPAGELDASRPQC